MGLFTLAMGIVATSGNDVILSDRKAGHGEASAVLRGTDAWVVDTPPTLADECSHRVAKD